MLIIFQVLNTLHVLTHLNLIKSIEAILFYPPFNLCINQGTEKLAQTHTGRKSGAELGF